MGRFTEKQLILATVGGSFLLAAGFGALIWLDLRAIHANEVTEQHPEAAEVTDPELWGERRKIQEIRKQMAVAKGEADLVPKREQDVIVYREIVARDAAILPDVDDVNNLARTINDFENQSGVQLRQVSDLSIRPGGEAIKEMPIKLQLSGTFDQFLKFVNLFESMDRIVNTRAFNVSAGRPSGQGRDRQAIHDIQLDLVTYIYTRSAGITRPVDIANYDKRKEDAVIQKLVRQQKAARVDKYQLRPRLNRRDPLIDPRRPGKDAAAASEGDVELQKKLVDKLKFEIELLKEDVRMEAQFVQEKRYVALAQIKPVIDGKVSQLEVEITQAVEGVAVAEFRESLHEEVVAPFEQIKGQRKLNPVPVVISRRQVEEFADQMRKHLEAREYEKVVKALANFESFVKGAPIAEDAADLAAEMRSMAHEAKVMTDFLGLKIAVSGLILRGEGSIVIVNGKSRKVGDFVDQANRCRLKEIAEDRLVFELEGLEIEHSLEKK